MKSAQIFLTPNEGKKLIADGLASLPMVEEALAEHTVVVVMGTTNAYLANALLAKIDEDGIEMGAFHRGITKPASAEAAASSSPVLSLVTAPASVVTVSAPASASASVQSI